MQGLSATGEFVDPSLIPRGPVRIVAFDGENVDPANGPKMWGRFLLAYTPGVRSLYAQAGKEGYERVRKSDERRIAPGAETLRELFGIEPTLIPLDELSVYLHKVHNLQDAAPGDIPTRPWPSKDYADSGESLRDGYGVADRAADTIPFTRVAGDGDFEPPGGTRVIALVR